MRTADNKAFRTLAEIQARTRQRNRKRPVVDYAELSGRSTPVRRPARSSRPIVCFPRTGRDDEHGAGSAVEKPLRDAAEEGACNASLAASADDDQLRFELGRGGSNEP